MSSQAYDWTQFSKQVYIDAPLADVFRMWATPDGIVQWFIAEADYHATDGERRGGAEIVQPGDRYHWQWHQPIDIRGEVLEVVENERFSFTFGKSYETGEDIVVTVTFEQTRRDTLITLHQHHMTGCEEDRVTWHLSCNLGWSFFMTNLKALMEYGADLREKDRERAYAARAVTH